MRNKLNNKRLNETLILNVIRKHSPISRTDIARMTGLSGATVTKFVDNLIQTGFVREDSYDVSKGGRRPTLLKLVPEASFAVGVDLGAANLRAVVVNLEANIVAKIAKKTRPDEGKDRVLKRITEIIYQVIDASGVEKEKIKGIGIGISGIIDHQKGICLFCPNIKGWENVPVKRLLEEEFGMEVSIDDSSRMAALAEHWCGLARKVENFIFIKVGVGVGSGVLPMASFTGEAEAPPVS